MINLESGELDIILGILSSNIKHGKVYIYGSRFTGANKPYSDVDLLFVGDFAQDEIINVKSEFELSDLPFRVDIAIYSELEDNFKQIVDSGKELIFAR